jgi:hypothetical protein
MIDQSSVIGIAILIGFVVFITLKGQLATYLNILIGSPSSPGTTVAVNTSASDVAAQNQSVVQQSLSLDAQNAQNAAYNAGVIAIYNPTTGQQTIVGCAPGYTSENSICVPLN